MCTLRTIITIFAVLVEKHINNKKYTIMSKATITSIVQTNAVGLFSITFEGSD